MNDYILHKDQVFYVASMDLSGPMRLQLAGPAADEYFPESAEASSWVLADECSKLRFGSSFIARERFQSALVNGTDIELSETVKLLSQDREGDWRVVRADGSRSTIFQEDIGKLRRASA